MMLKVTVSLLLVAALAACTSLQSIVETGRQRLIPSTEDSALGLPDLATPAFPVPVYPTETPSQETGEQLFEIEIPEVPITTPPPVAPELTPATPVSPALSGGVQPLASEGVYYAPQTGTPLGLRNFVYPDLGCSWMGVGGQVFGSDGWPVAMLVVELGGALAGEPVSRLTLTGSAQQWGPGGFEFTLSSQPISSQHSLYIQFYDIEGNQLSDSIYFNTYNDCDRNAIMINMVQVPRPLYDFYFPLIPQDFQPAP
jgi:hypothetical protein